jgi:hypothetical protein
VLRQALPTAAIWLAFVVALDLPSLVAASGVAFAFLFAWWNEQKPEAAQTEERWYADEDVCCQEDELFDEQLTVLDV